MKKLLLKLSLLVVLFFVLVACSSSSNDESITLDSPVSGDRNVIADEISVKADEYYYFHEYPINSEDSPLFPQRVSEKIAYLGNKIKVQSNHDIDLTMAFYDISSNKLIGSIGDLERTSPALHMFWPISAGILIEGFDIDIHYGFNNAINVYSYQNVAVTNISDELNMMFREENYTFTSLKNGINEGLFTIFYHSAGKIEQNALLDAIARLNLEGIDLTTDYAHNESIRERNIIRYLYGDFQISVREMISLYSLLFYKSDFQEGLNEQKYEPLFNNYTLAGVMEILADNLRVVDRNFNIFENVSNRALFNSFSNTVIGQTVSGFCLPSNSKFVWFVGLYPSHEPEYLFVANLSHDLTYLFEASQSATISELFDMHTLATLAFELYEYMFASPESSAYNGRILYPSWQDAYKSILTRYAALPMAEINKILPVDFDTGWHFILYDIDKDGIPELFLVEVYAALQNWYRSIYTFYEGQIVDLGFHGVLTDGGFYAFKCSSVPWVVLFVYVGAGGTYERLVIEGSSLYSAVTGARQFSNDMFDSLDPSEREHFSSRSDYYLDLYYLTIDNQSVSRSEFEHYFGRRSDIFWLAPILITEENIEKWLYAYPMC